MSRSIERGPVDNDIIEGYLIRGEIDYDTVGEGMWVVHDDIDHVDNIVVTYAPPVVLFRVKLMELPQDSARWSALFQRLLRLNATEMVAGAYGIEGNAIIACETLQAENLDFNEFQAAIDGLTLAITEHYEVLKEYHSSASGNGSGE